MILFLSLTGCAKLQHLDQLLTLKSLSKEKDEMGTIISDQNNKFEFLKKVVNDGSIIQYSTKKSALLAFGDPIMVHEVVENEKTLEYWIYRYQQKYFDSDKVYLYFDGNTLTRWEYRPVEVSEFDEVSTSTSP
jgi:hypothetical protein